VLLQGRRSKSKGLKSECSDVPNALWAAGVGWESVRIDSLGQPRTVGERGSSIEKKVSHWCEEKGT